MSGAPVEEEEEEDEEYEQSQRGALAQRGYSVVKELGRGAFGSALVVRHTSCEVELVAKEVDIRQLPKCDVEASRNEVAVLVQLDHPNITRFIEAFEADGIIFTVMEYADGGDLQQVLRRRKDMAHPRPFPENAVLDYFIQLSFALRHLHKKKVLHRDLKTANVFLTAQHMIKLGDFGVAKRTGEVGLAATVCGTPYYFSPEMCRGEPYSDKCDVWALGVILYELMWLRKPFYGQDSDDLMENIEGCAYEPLPRNLGFSDELRGACHALLTLRTSDRPHVHDIMGGEYMQRELSYFAQRVRDRAVGQIDWEESPRRSGSPRR